MLACLNKTNAELKTSRLQRLISNNAPASGTSLIAAEQVRPDRKALWQVVKRHSERHQQTQSQQVCCSRCMSTRAARKKVLNRNDIMLGIAFGELALSGQVTACLFTFSVHILYPEFWASHWSLLSTLDKVDLLYKVHLAV